MEKDLIKYDGIEFSLAVTDNHWPLFLLVNIFGKKKIKKTSSLKFQVIVVHTILT
jgi:uncharacterized protein YllA (UPF0747 family)